MLVLYLYYYLAHAVINWLQIVRVYFQLIFALPRLFRRNGNFSLLAKPGVIFWPDRFSISCCWLIPAVSLQQIAYARADQLIVVASPAETSKDRFSAYRHDRFEDAVAELAQIFVTRQERQLEGAT